MEKNVFASLPADFGKSLIYHGAPLVTWFIGLIDWSQSVRQMVYPITSKVPAPFQVVLNGVFPDGYV